MGDLRERKIPNIWALMNIAVYCFVFFFFPTFYDFNLKAMLFPMAFIGVGFVLFVFKIMGGGDSKFLASLFLIIPVKFQDKMFHYLILTTFLIGITFLIRSIWIHRKKLQLSFQRRDINGIKECFGSKFAYAPVVLISWVYLGWDYRKIFF